MMSERENGWYLRSDGYITSECSCQRITAMKGNRALDNHEKLVFVKYMGGEEIDSRVYVPHPGMCEPKWVLQGTTQTQEFWRCECGNCGECFGVEDRSSFPLKTTIGEVDIQNYCPNCGKAVKR